MKTFGKIIICIIVVLLAIGIAYLVYDGKETNNNALPNTNTSTNANNSNNNKEENKTSNEIDKNTDYIGQEENKEEEPKEDEEPETTDSEEGQTQELTGKDKAISIVKTKYALDGQIVRFDHMEGEDYVIKMNDGTAVTWYLVSGTTWEAEEY